jgi:hypothetical protein
MAQSGYEIRYSLLNDARHMLYEKWHQDIELIRRNHDIDRKPIIESMPAPPTAAQIKALAEELYEFVQRR